MNQTPPRGERGFALLIVFLMAAAIALMLYRQIPRVAFESQRDKEETLIERGEQYKRAIQLYFIAFKKYPAKIEDLESTNDKRFLRRRYIDPMTGKDEWRLVHVNGAGQLTDSKVEKPPDPANDKTQLAGNPSAPGANPAALGVTANNPANPGAPPEVNTAVLRRPSDRSLVPTPVQGVDPSGGAPGVDPNDPRTWPPISLQPAQGASPNPGQPGVNPQGFVQQFPGQQFPGQQYTAAQPIPGQQFPGQPNAGQPFPVQLLPGQQLPGQQFPGQQFPGQPSAGQQVPVQQFSGQTGQQVQIQQFPGQPDPNQPFPVQPGVPGNPNGPFPGQPGFNPQNFNPNNPGPGNQFVQPPPNQVTPQFNPQPGNFPPQPVPPPQQAGGSAPNGQAPNGQTGAPNPALNMINDLLRTPRQAPNAPQPAANPMNTGGLAGVATTYSGPSIKTYRERSKYQEWEFIFDLKQGLPGQPANQQQRLGGSNQPSPLQPGAPAQPQR